MNDIYLVLAVYDKSDKDTAVSLYGAFHSKKEARNYQQYLADAITDGDKEPFHIKRIKNVCPYERLIVDEPCEIWWLGVTAWILDWTYHQS